MRLIKLSWSDGQNGRVDGKLAVHLCREADLAVAEQGSWGAVR